MNWVLLPDEELSMASFDPGERRVMIVADTDAGRSAAEWANDLVLACYQGEGQDGVHLLGPLAKKVVRVAPPLVITEDETRAAMALMGRCAARVCGG